MSENGRKLLPPYMPYKTFGTFLDHLRAIGMPSHIDKSVMANLSGGMQSWLKAALRYMKLINADDTPTAMLEKLAAAQGDDRKALLRELFSSSYAFLNGKVDLKNTTPVKLRQALVDEGGQGETVEKILAFMIAMAKDAGVSMSTLLTKRAPSVRRPRTKPTERPTPNGDSSSEDDDTADGEDGPDASMKTITLPKSGGTLTLSGNINLFTLVGNERELVFKLIDTMTAFEAEQGGDDA
jgi:hypothetical protein